MESKLPREVFDHLDGAGPTTTDRALSEDARRLKTVFEESSAKVRPEFVDQLASRFVHPRPTVMDRLMDFCVQAALEGRLSSFLGTFGALQTYFVLSGSPWPWAALISFLWAWIVTASFAPLLKSWARFPPSARIVASPVLALAVGLLALMLHQLSYAGLAIYVGMDPGWAWDMILLNLYLRPEATGASLFAAAGVGLVASLVSEKLVLAAPWANSKPLGWGQRLMAWLMIPTIGGLILLSWATAADHQRRSDPNSSLLLNASLNDAVASGDTSTVRRIFRLEPRAYQWNYLGYRPLDSVTTTQMTEQILQLGAPVNEVNRHGHTALWHAVSAGHLKVVVRLLERGADPNLAQEKSTPPLHEAARLGRADLVEALLSGGARHDTAVHAKTALEVALQAGHSKVAERLRRQERNGRSSRP